MSNSIEYCESLTKYVRRKSRVIQIGDIPLGGNYPIRVQSMTTTNTMDTQSTVEQSIRMIEAGSEYVKILAQIIVQNRLMDFEPVRLENSIKRQELNL